LANEIGCGFIEVSAKNNLNIAELFQELSLAIYKRDRSLNKKEEDEKIRQRGKSFAISGSPDKGKSNKKGCC